MAAPDAIGVGSAVAVAERAGVDVGERVAVATAAVGVDVAITVGVASPSRGRRRCLGWSFRRRIAGTGDRLQLRNANRPINVSLDMILKRAHRRWFTTGMGSPVGAGANQALALISERNQSTVWRRPSFRLVVGDHPSSFFAREASRLMRFKSPGLGGKN